MREVPFRLWAFVVVLALGLTAFVAFEQSDEIQPPTTPVSNTVVMSGADATTSARAARSYSPGAQSDSVVQFADEAAPTPSGFRHPGILTDLDQLDYVRAQAVLGNQPWADALAKAKTQKDLTTRTTPRLTTMLRADNAGQKCDPNNPGSGCVVNCGSSSNPNNGCSEETVDFEAANTQALLWYLTGEESYAQSAVAIINGWSAVLKSHTGSNAPLQAAWSADSVTRAAEILRYTYVPSPGQPALDVDAFTSMMRTAFLPVIQGGIDGGRFAKNNGNWDLAGIDALMNIAVFTDDRALFDTAIGRWRARVPAYIYLGSDGPLPVGPPGGTTTSSGITCLWLNNASGCGSAVTKFEDGQSQETCRDTSHVAMGFASMFDTAETAYLQGVDLYSAEKTRLAAGLEHVTRLLNDVTAVAQYPADFCIGHGTLRAPIPEPTFEIGYNALVNRAGLSLPATSATVRRLRAPAVRSINRMMAFETLTHADTGNPCGTPENRFGKAYLSAAVPASGDYRIWARVKSAQASAEPLRIQVDGGCPIELPLDSASAGEWTWVGAPAAADGAPPTRALTEGKHLFTVTAGAAGLAVDQVLVTDDQTCVPDASGCPVADPDTTDPAQPQALALLSADETTASMTWQPSTDDSPVRYQVFRDDQLVATTQATDVTDRGLRPDSSYVYTVRALDSWNNRSAASDPLSVRTAVSTDSSPPTAPEGLTSTVVTSTSVRLVWSASSDDRAVDHYTVLRDTLPVGETSTSDYTDTALGPATGHDYAIVAVDAAANRSQPSATLRVVTAPPPDTSPPSLPGSLLTQVAGLGRVNLSWSASTDDVGVVGYRLTRNGVPLGTTSTTAFQDSGAPPGALATYTVAAYDAAGNTSPVATAAVTTQPDTAPLGPGLAGSYFDNTTLSGQAIGRLDPTVSFAWGTGSPMPGISADRFSARWTGLLTPTRSGTYTFYTQADNGVRLYLNDTLLINGWSSSANTALSKTASLTAGTSYNLRVEYVENTGSANVKLQWSGPGIAKATLPSSVLTSASRGLSASYFANSALTGAPSVLRPDATVNFSWGSAAPDSRLLADGFSARWRGKVVAPTTGAVTFWTDSDDGVRLWVGNQLVIDNWSSSGPTTRSAKVDLVAKSLYDLRLEYQDRTSTASAKLSWSYGTTGKTIVPTTALRDR